MPYIHDNTAGCEECHMIADVTENELIDLARDNKIIDRQKADALHHLRMCRNGFQHPELKQISYDKATLEKWKDIVFSLKGGKNEPRS